MGFGLLELLYGPTRKPKPKQKQKQTKRALPSSPSSPPSPQKKRKRRGATAPSSSRPHLENEYLPGPAAAAADEGAALGSLDFHEILDEDALGPKTAVVNRAPVMMAWASVVAERLGFSREEALSIGTPSPTPPPSFRPACHMTAIHHPRSVGIHRNERGLQRSLTGHLRQEARSRSQYCSDRRGITAVRRPSRPPRSALPHSIWIVARVHHRG